MSANLPGSRWDFTRGKSSLDRTSLDRLPANSVVTEDDEDGVGDGDGGCCCCCCGRDRAGGDCGALKFSRIFHVQTNYDCDDNDDDDDFKMSARNEHRSSRGNYLRHKVIDSLTNFYLTVFLLIVIFSSGSASIMGEHCDWSGNGLSLSPSQGRGVTPVYLRCVQGRVTWTYPRGALRVLLRLPNSEREFRGCIRVTPDFAGARLFLEGQRSLSPLFSLDDGGHKQLIRCFQSKKGQAAIYVEAVNESGEFKKEVAGFSYDLHPVPRGSSVFDLINDGCRPCSRQEMAHAFCTNDLVIRGLIHGIDVRPELETAEINVKITKVLRHSTDDLYGSGPFRSGDPGPGNKIESSEGKPGGKRFGESDIVKLVMPTHCHPHHGPGEFVFMGRKRLGDLSMVCVASLSEWAEIVRTLNSDGTSHCVLKS